MDEERLTAWEKKEFTGSTSSREEIDRSWEGAPFSCCCNETGKALLWKLWLAAGAF